MSDTLEFIETRDGQIIRLSAIVTVTTQHGEAHATLTSGLTVRLTDEDAKQLVQVLTARA